MTPSNLKKFPRRIGRFFDDSKGTTAIMMAILTPFILAGLAFGSEYGYFELAKRRLQNAADTSAFAAGTQLRSGLGNSEMEVAALVVAEESGYDDTTGTLTLSNPPVSGAYAGDDRAVQVALSQPVERRFSKVFFNHDVTVNVASVVLVLNGRPACILSLNPSMNGAIQIDGSTTVHLDGCDVAANSISDTAISSGGAAAYLETECVTTVGGADDPHNNFTMNDCNGPIENAPVTADPYADVPEPTWTSCDTANGFKLAGTPSAPAPGCYTGVNSLTRDVVLSPGVYILKDSDLQMTADHTISGTDVTIFLTGNSGITIVGNATIDIKAPTSGPYSGIAIFTDRDEEIDLDLSGNIGVSIVGAIYSPNFSSDVTYIGNTTAFLPGECTQVIAGGQITFSGDSDFTADCTDAGTAAIMAAQSIQIVE